MVRHLAHELRQPLSGIESTVFYLEMVTPKSDPRLLEQFERLHQLIQQASWILEDSVHSMRPLAPDAEELDLNRLVSDAASVHAVHEEGNFRLKLDSGVPRIRLDPRHGGYLIATVIDFYRHVARCAECITFSTRSFDGLPALFISAETAQPDPQYLRRMLDPLAEAGDDCDDSNEDLHIPMGSLRRTLEANGGQFSVDIGAEGRLTVEMRFCPA